ncbi:glycosyltransferase [Jiangella anatolica]|uniref:Glycosyltransferase n=1 Tax=Jiangella anatolica TaxID=2670374 RepID=A0A2W2C2J8_9ACTN|nr:glycosyltransferase [Jiangella anatolica]PZF82419.1 glycosyltransferase [Jiangella anatolica]
MRALLITHGSRGDVQPFAALASALARAGHTSVLAAPAASAGLGEPFSERVVRLHDGPNELAGDMEVVKGLEAGFRGLHGRRRLLTTVPKTRRLVRAVLDDLSSMARDIVEARREAFDVVVHHVSGGGHDVAEFLGVPSVLMCPQPYWVPTEAFPDPSFRWRPPRQFNRATYVSSRAIWWLFSGSSTQWRRERLGLRSRPGGRFRQVDGSPTTVLHPFSSRLLPPTTSYPPWVHTTGFWSQPAAGTWVPPASLAAFLATGPPPVYVGFASTVTSDPHRLARLVREAVRLARVRAVVVGGWSGMAAADLGDDIAFVDTVPFGWLFPQMAAIVHHGGLGTTGEAMMAARPQVVCPSLPDQRFNAQRLCELGVAAPTSRLREVTAEQLALAIRRAAHDGRLAARAEQLGREISGEDGAVEAVRIVEAIVTGDRARLVRQS